MATVREFGRKPAVDRSIAARLTPRLAHKFCAVPSFFLSNYSQLKPHAGARGLNSTEAMTVIQLLDYKWDKRAPFPTVGALADRMGLKPRTVRAAIKNLEGLGYVRRVALRQGGANRYIFDGLFKVLERMMDEKGLLDFSSSAEESANSPKAEEDAGEDLENSNAGSASEDW
jgi:DNA-binding transcriptional ArsR family regulator